MHPAICILWTKLVCNISIRLTQGMKLKECMWEIKIQLEIKHHLDNHFLVLQHSNLCLMLFRFLWRQEPYPCLLSTQYEHSLSFGYWLNFFLWRSNILSTMFNFLFPSFQPIPNSLNTLYEFMSRMEQTLTQNGDDVEIVALLLIVWKEIKIFIFSWCLCRLSVKSFIN